MFNRKSIYALNKKDPNAIVYTDADGKLIRLTCDDFACAAEFRRWKDWSDSDLRKEENADHTPASMRSRSGWSAVSAGPCIAAAHGHETVKSESCGAV